MTTWTVKTEVIRVPATGSYWLQVEPPNASLAAAPLRGFEHALLRPYEKVASLGNPIVGSVQYQFVKLPVLRKSSVLFSTAVRPTGPPNRPPLLPGNLFVFPGIRYDRIHTRDDFSGYIHHISVRELTGRRIEVYVNSRSADDPDEPVRSGRTAEISPEAGILHVAQMYLRDRDALDDADVAMERLSEGAVKAMTARGQLSPDPFIENHPHTTIPENPALAMRPHHFWCGLFLCRTPPTDATAERVLEFFLHKVQHKAVEFDAEYDGMFNAHASVVDFSQFSGEAAYRYVVTLSAIVPGTLKSSTGLVAFPRELSFIETPPVEQSASPDEA